MAKRATAQEERRAREAGEPKIGGDESQRAKRARKGTQNIEGHLFFPKNKTGGGKIEPGGILDIYYSNII